MRLAELIDWHAFANEWSLQFLSPTGRPALPTRLMASLLYLKHVYAPLDAPPSVPRLVTVNRTSARAVAAASNGTSDSAAAAAPRRGRTQLPMASNPGAASRPLAGPGTGVLKVLLTIPVSAELTV